MIELFMFPNKTAAEIYKKYEINFVYIYQILTNTDSTSLQFVIFFKDQNTVEEEKFGDMIFEVISKNKIINRFDVLHDFWDKFNVQDKNTKKRMTLFETEHIDDPCYICIAVNPKEYNEKFKSNNINKKHKRIRKDTNAMDIASYG